MVRRCRTIIIAMHHMSYTDWMFMIAMITVMVVLTIMMIMMMRITMMMVMIMMTRMLRVMRMMVSLRHVWDEYKGEETEEETTRGTKIFFEKSLQSLLRPTN